MKFGQSFEIFAKILLNNAGFDSNKKLPDFISQNKNECKYGVDVFNGEIKENFEVYDSYASKLNSIRLASKTALTILRID